MNDESQSDADTLNRKFLSIFDLAQWDLIDPTNMPNLDIDLKIPAIEKPAYLFLRRIIQLLKTDAVSTHVKNSLLTFLHGSLKSIYSIMSRKYSKFIGNISRSRKFELLDAIMVMGTKCVFQLLDNSYLFEANINRVKNHPLPFFLHERVGFFQPWFLENPTNDPLLNVIEHYFDDAPEI